MPSRRGVTAATERVPFLGVADILTEVHLAIICQEVATVSALIEGIDVSIRTAKHQFEVGDHVTGIKVVPAGEEPLVGSCTWTIKMRGGEELLIRLIGII